MINNGQQEETIRELATTLVLEPGQIAVIGCRPEYKRSLGSFMLTQSVAHSDQRIEKLIMIWASRNLQGQGDNDGAANTTDRPTLFQRLMGPTPGSNRAKPAPPTPEIPPIDTSVPTAAVEHGRAATGRNTTGHPARPSPTAHHPRKLQTTGNERPGTLNAAERSGWDRMIRSGRIYATTSVWTLNQASSSKDRRPWMDSWRTDRVSWPHLRVAEIGTRPRRWHGALRTRVGCRAPPPPSPVGARTVRSSS